MVIRTNSSGTNITIDAPLDVVYRYGEAGTVTINAIAGNSYHEHGVVGFLEIATGRISLEKGSVVSKLHLNATTINANTTEEEKVFKDIVVAYDAAIVELPQFSRDDVEIPTGGKFVVELQKVETINEEETTSSDYVWLTKQGIFEQIKVSDSSEEITEEAKWADDGNVVEKTQTAAMQIANNIGRDSDGKIDEVIEINDGEASGSYKVGLDDNRDFVIGSS